MVWMVKRCFLYPNQKYSIAFDIKKYRTYTYQTTTKQPFMHKNLL